MPHYPATTPVTFQIVLYEGSNDFDIRLRNVRPDYGNHVIGWEDTTGTRGTTVRYGRPSFSNQVVRVSANPGLAGGDLYGYRWTRTQNSFEDITASGTQVPLGDDTMSGAIPMGFEFRFYDGFFNDAYISSNGFLTFEPGSSSGCCSGQLMPDASDPDNLIAGFWEDLNPAAGGSVWYETRGNAPNRRFIVQYEDVPHSPSGNVSTFQMVLFEGRGDFQIAHQHTAHDGGNHAIGFENEDGTIGNTIDFGGVEYDDTTWRITAPARRDGPDGYGYTWRSTNYSWEEISGTNDLNLYDDQTSGGIPIGFDFDYYGTDRSTVYVSSNGFITFLPNQSNSCCTGRDTPNPSYADGIIAGLWEDLNPWAGGDIWYTTRGTPGARRFIVEFENVPHYPNTQPVTFQIVLYESTGDFEIRHQRTSSDAGHHVVGFENDAGNDGLLIASGRVAFTERAWRVFSPSAEGTGGPYEIDEFSSLLLRGRCDGCSSFSWDFDNDGDFDDATGPAPTFSADGIDGPVRMPLNVRGCTGTGSCTEYASYVDVLNAPPVFDTQPESVAAMGRQYRYEPEVHDPAGSMDPVHFELGRGPSGMTVDRTTGVVLWTPSANATSVPVELRAIDDEGGVQVQAWSLDVVNMGPDNFGYTWAPSNYDWEDISNGTQVNLSDDSVSGALPIGFTFNYYGRQYNNAYISSNGFLTFLPRQSNSCCSGRRMPYSGYAQGMIAGLWEDLNPPRGGWIRYATRGSAPNRRFVMTFNDIRHYSNSLPVTFQIVLHEGAGHFDIVHQHIVSDSDRHSVGFENHYGTDGLSIRYGRLTGDNQAYRITAPGDLEITTDDWTVSGQPEHVDFSVASTAPAAWMVSLYRHAQGACAADPFVVQQATGTDAFSGTFLGLSAGERYCYKARAESGADNEEVTGDFLVPALHEFTDGPRTRHSGLDVVIDAEFSESVEAGVMFQEGSCAAAHSAYDFHGASRIMFPGRIIPNNNFSVMLWAFPTTANQTVTIWEAEGGNVHIGMQGGLLTASLRTESGNVSLTGSVLPVREDSLVGVTYDGQRFRLYSGGRLDAYQSIAGDLAGYDWGQVSGQKPYAMLGASVNGFRGHVAALVVDRVVRTPAQIDAIQTDGPSNEIPVLPETVAAWHFNEGPSVQSVYDIAGSNWSGWLGTDETEDASDPDRLPDGMDFSDMGSGSSFTHHLTDLSGGPTFCYRVVSRVAGRVTASRWGEFVRPVDITPPTVSGPPTVAAECVINEAAELDLERPSVSDNADPAPSLVAKVGNVAIQLPYEFDLGDTVVVWEARDSSGNVGTLRQTVRVLDRVNPTANGGSLVTVEATSPDGTPYAPEPEAASDTCSDVDVTHDGPQAFALGQRRVTFTVEDPTGNRVQVTRDYNFVDTTAPAFEDEPLPTMRIAHPGTSCHEYAPPPMPYLDNGYPNEQLTVEVQGVPECWTLGESRTITWRLTDPAGNSRTVDQNVSVGEGRLRVGLASMIVDGTAVQAGRYYNAPMEISFNVGLGSAPYQVQVNPAPTSLTESNGVWTARYESEGLYDRIVVNVTDAQDEVGAAAFDGFGIDTTPPTIDASRFLEHANIDMNDPDSFPWFFSGETINIEQFRATDGPFAPTGLGHAGYGDTAPHGLMVPGAPAMGGHNEMTFEVWVYNADQGMAIARGFDESIEQLDFLVMIEPEGIRAVVVLPEEPWFVSIEIPDTTPPPGWHHYGIVIDETAMSLWFDGERKASRSLPVMFESRPEFPSIVQTMPGGAYAQVGVHARAFTRQEMADRWAGGRGRPVDIDEDTLVALRLDDDPTSQVVRDHTSHGHHGFLGGEPVVDPFDSALRPIEAPPAPEVSGLVGYSLELVQFPMSAPSEMLQVAATPSGGPVATGVRILNGPCNGPVGAVCTPGDRNLHIEQVQTWAQATNAAFVIRATAMDAAGNEVTQMIPFNVADLSYLLNRMQTDLEDERLMYGSDGLDDAISVAETAHAYLNMNRPYVEGSYLAVSHAMGYLRDAVDVGADELQFVTYILARAVRADVARQLNGLPATSEEDIEMRDHALQLLELSWLAIDDEEYGVAVELARSALDSAALLYEPYQALRSTRRTAFNSWQAGLQQVGAGGLSLEGLRVGQSRMNQVARMLIETRNVLRDTLYPEISAAMDNPFTTERGSMDLMKDLINRESNDPNEVGDLLAVTDPSIDGACLDRLTSFDLDDDEFTLCYLKLIEVVRALEEVSEALVHSHRWRTGLALATFNMLAVTMEIGPTAVPWVASGQPYPTNLVLVLPDAQASEIDGAVALSTVDQPDSLLQWAYASYYAAIEEMRDGMIDEAFVRFADSRCAVARVYNRYYSTNNPVGTVADPAEAPLNLPPELCD